MSEENVSATGRQGAKMPLQSEAFCSVSSNTTLQHCMLSMKDKAEPLDQRTITPGRGAPKNPNSIKSKKAFSDNGGA